MNVQRRGPRRPHLLGIGGVGMAALAELLQADGAHVSGSDRSESPVLERLRSLGIDAYAPHRGSAPADADAVVVSSAIKPDNPELLDARARDVPVLHRSEALAALAANRRLIAVAGAHGKTTTSAMVTAILRQAGWDPTFAIGGEVIGLGTGAHLGTSDVMVAEVDESDGTFLNFAPTIAVVTNVEPDHLDHYGSTADFEDAFRQFTERIKPGGLLIACQDDPGSAALADHVEAGGGHVWRYGSAPECDVVIEHEPHAGGGSHVTISLRPAASRESHPPVTAGFELGLVGHHQALNAGAAYAAACAIGVDPLSAVGGLESFSGTRRRFELRGSVEGVDVYDDYAHHPSEIAAMLSGARLKVGPGRVIVLFQPHLYSRTVSFADRFALALEAADEVVVLDIYGAREEPRPGVSSRLITEKMRSARFEPDRLEAVRLVAHAARPGDIVVTVGAGDVTHLADAILQELAER